MTEKPSYEELEKRIQELEQTELNRKRIEEQLIHSNDLLDYIISHARSAIAVHDKDLKYIYVSKRYLKDYKVKEKNVIGKHHYEVFPDLPQKWREVHQKSLAGEVLSAEEDPYYREDGLVDWTRWECRPWHEFDGSIGGIIIYTEVVTDRKQTENLLRISEARLREAQRIAQIGNWELDLISNTLFWSDEIYRIFGLKPQQFDASYEGFLENIHPDDRAIVDKAYSDSLKNKTTYNIVHRLLLRDGTIKFVNEHCETFYDESGKATRSVGTIQDITERKQVEDSLHKTQVFNKTLLDTSPDLIYVYDIIARKNIYINQGIMKILGYSIQEVQEMGETIIADLMHPDDFNRYLKEIIPCYQTARDEEIIEHEYRMKHKDGTWTWLQSKELIFLRLSDGSPRQIFGITADITEKKQSEKKLQRAYDEMEIKVEQRTKDLSQANIKLKELDRLKSMFIASMSHELRTPLNSIIGFTGLLLQGISGKIDAEAVEDLNIVYNSSKHLLNLINDVIDISKIEADKLDIHFEKVKIKDVVEEIVSIVSKDAEKKNLKIKTEFPDGLTIISDKRRLFQCILNLMSNAIKFTEKGVVKLKIEKAAGLLRIRVTDTGIGIKKEDLPKLFKSFVRLETPLKEETAGTGLGLYLTQKIMTTVFQGGISLESEYGKGSAFTLEIPLKQTIEP